MSDGTPGSGFAELLRELKDRSGLSYGTLAKRLHMSTSTLHRYCNGDAVPTDYAPVERLARLCKAGPAELVEPHRRWVLADADRGRKQEAADRREEREAREERATREARVAGPVPVADAAPENDASATVGAEHAVQEGPLAVSASAAGSGAGDGAAVGAGGGGRSRWAPRPVLLAGTVAVALLGAAVFAVGLPSGGSGDDKHAGPAGAATPLTRGPRTPTPSPSGTPSGATPSRSASASASATDRAAEAGTAPSSAAGGTGTGTSAAPPLTVNTQPYSWESPCSQRYLIDRPPADVAPPPVESDAAAWVAAHQAVSSGEQYVTLTVQGTGTESVVLESLTVRTVDRGAPLAWNDYAMGYPGVGCGAGVPTRSFTVALDAMRPAVVPEAGHRDFPFKVSESDPEVFYVRADASAYSVGWYLELAWSSGSRHGTLRIGDKGRPFRTSGNNGRPAYEFPLGGEAWRSGSPASAG
ncbi:helix-turn-helix domain-containing protein [Streptomyces arenae]|uniref:helix-turn-helix domain-containing protein n=1 Tax=Streptomyces arenae TaxID=29301 RepID=UPI00265B2266|nr:helix-turn-helix transcriptional regulator [Streptomyces arenae]MCG7210778.1 helix-turn-helix domain-containing protein [Streptomyces arenae]